LTNSYHNNNNNNNNKVKSKPLELFELVGKTPVNIARNIRGADTVTRARRYVTKNVPMHLKNKEIINNVHRAVKTKNVPGPVQFCCCMKTWL
jgi:hypothetical protein